MQTLDIQTNNGIYWKSENEIQLNRIHLYNLNKVLVHDNIMYFGQIFNELVVVNVSEEEALEWDVEWKLPVLLLYTKKDKINSPVEQDDGSWLFQQQNMFGPITGL